MRFEGHFQLVGWAQRNTLSPGLAQALPLRRGSSSPRSLLLLIQQLCKTLQTTVSGSASNCGFSLVVKQDLGSPCPDSPLFVGLRVPEWMGMQEQPMPIPSPSGMLRAPAAPWLLCGPSLEAWCDSREMGIRDTVPGMCPHPVGWDSLERGQPGSKTQQSK